jgi:DNA-binding response OmpR family regulator
MSEKLKGKTILVVDDEEDILETVSEFLDMCNVVSKTNYQDALDYLQANEVDLVLLDIMGVNGFELLEHAVSQEIPAVMMTAHALSVETLKKSIDIGARAYIPKEKMAELIPFLEDVLTMGHEETWNRVFKRLKEFFNDTFGADWKKDIIETGPFIVMD